MADDTQQIDWRRNLVANILSPHLTSEAKAVLVLAALETSYAEGVGASADICRGVAARLIGDRKLVADTLAEALGSHCHFSIGLAMENADG